MGGGGFHSKGTWGCAARRGILSRTSGLAKGILFAKFSMGNGMLFGTFGHRKGNFCMEIKKFLVILVSRRRKFGNLV